MKKRIDAPKPSVVFTSPEMLYRFLPELYQKTNFRGGLGVLANCIWGGFERMAPDLMDAVMCVPLYWRPWFQQGKRLNLREILGDPMDTIGVRFESRDYYLPVWDVAAKFKPDRRTPLYGFGMPDVDDMPVLYTDHQWSNFRQYVIFGYAIPKFLERIVFKPNIAWLNESHTVPFIARTRKDKNPFFKGMKMLFALHTLQQAAMKRFYDQRFEQMDLAGSHWENIFVHHGALDFTYAAVCLADKVVCVTGRHGELTRDILFPEFEGKITHVTNGSDAEFWMNPLLWQRVQNNIEIDGNIIYNARLAKKNEVFPIIMQEFPDKELYPEVFTIGFARRPSEYKNLWDMLSPILPALCADRGSVLQTSVGNLEGRAIQFFIAGKAPEGDGTCNWWIPKFLELASQHEGMRKRCVIYHDYGLRLLQWTAQALDGCPETSRPDEEACGTSPFRIRESGGTVFSSALGSLENTIDVEENPEQGNGYILRGKDYSPLATYRKICHAQDMHDAYVTGYNPGPYLRLLENSFNLGRELDIVNAMEQYRSIFINMLQ